MVNCIIIFSSICSTGIVFCLGGCNLILYTIYITYVGPQHINQKRFAPCTFYLKSSFVDFAELASCEFPCQKPLTFLKKYSGRHTLIHQNLVLILFLSQGKLSFSGHLHMRMVQNTTLTNEIWGHLISITSGLWKHHSDSPCFLSFCHDNEGGRSTGDAATSLTLPKASVKLTHTTLLRHTYHYFCRICSVSKQLYFVS